MRRSFSATTTSPGGSIEENQVFYLKTERLRQGLAQARKGAAAPDWPALFARLASEARTPLLKRFYQAAW